MKEIRPNGVVYVKEGVEHFIEADTVVTSCGVRPRKKEANAFVEMMPDVTVVGDARKSGKIFDANMDAFDVAVEL